MCLTGNAAVSRRYPDLACSATWPIVVPQGFFTFVCFSVCFSVRGTTLQTTCTAVVNSGRCGGGVGYCLDLLQALPVSVYPDTTQPCSLSIAGKQLAIRNSNPSFFGLFLGFVHLMEFGTLVFWWVPSVPTPTRCHLGWGSECTLGIRFDEI